MGSNYDIIRIMNDWENTHPNLKYIPASIIGGIGTFLLFSLAIFTGTLISWYSNDVFSRNIGYLFGSINKDLLFSTLLPIVLVAVCLSILVHNDLRRAIRTSFLIIASTWILITIYTYGFASNGGESAIGLGVFFIPFILGGLVLASLLFRVLKNRLGILGTILGNFLIIATITMFGL